MSQKHDLITFYKSLPEGDKDIVLFILDEMQQDFSDKRIDQLNRRIGTLDEKIKFGQSLEESRKNSQDSIDRILSFANKFDKLGGHVSIEAFKEILVSRKDDLRRLMGESDLPEWVSKRDRLKMVKEKLFQRKMASEAYYKCFANRKSPENRNSPLKSEQLEDGDSSLKSEQFQDVDSPMKSEQL